MSRHVPKLAWVVLLAAGFAAGCGGAPTPSTSSEPADASPEAAAAAPADAAPGAADPTAAAGTAAVAAVDPAAPVAAVTPVDGAAPAAPGTAPAPGAPGAPPAPGAAPVPGAPAAPAPAPTTPADAGSGGSGGSGAPAPSASAAVAAAVPAATTDPGPAPAARGPTSYRLDPGSSWIYAVLKYDRNAPMKGHDHVIKASSFDGSVVWSPTDPSACKVEISFPVTALVVDPPGSRSRAGLEGDTPEGDLPKIKENMLSKTQLNSSVFPRISFSATSCSGTSGAVKVTGNLTIRGASKPVTATMDITEDGSSFRAKGSLNITHRQFGFDPYVAALGLLKNDDGLKLVIDVRGSR